VREREYQVTAYRRAAPAFSDRGESESERVGMVVYPRKSPSSHCIFYSKTLLN